MNEVVKKGHELIERIDRYQRVEQSELELICDDLLREFGERTDNDEPELWSLVHSLISAGFPHLPVPTKASGFWSANVLAVLQWRERNYDAAAKRYSEALKFASTDEERFEASRMQARVSFEGGYSESAIAILESLDLSQAPPETVNLIGMTLSAIAPEKHPQGHEDLDRVLSLPRSLFRARYRIWTLYNAKECALRLGATELSETISELLYALSIPTGMPFLVFSNGLSLAHALRTNGELTRAMDILNSLPVIRFDSFDSRDRVRTELSLCKLAIGDFEGADHDIVQSLQFAERTGDHPSAANLLAIRCAAWAALGDFERALPASRQAAEKNDRPLNHLVRAVCEFVVGDGEKALELESLVFDSWFESDHPAPKTIALGLRGVLRQDKDAVDHALRVATHAESPFVGFAEGCEKLLNRERITDPEKLWGSVAGVVLYALSKRLNPAPIEDLEEGLYKVAGKTIDLRRRHAMRKILVAMREAPERLFDVVDLFEIGWGESPLPTTYADRVYFAIYELRRLGFRDWLDNTEDGYRWREGSQPQAEEV